MATRSDPTESTELRRQAEKKLLGRPKANRLTKSEGETSRLLHELQVHEIELEMQNEELQRANAKIETGLKHYTELFDFAPVGYFRLDADATIHEVNLAGAALLGAERTQLVGSRLQRFVPEESRPRLAAFMAQTFATETMQICEIELLLRKNAPAVLLELAAARSPAQRKCLAVATDITERRRAEAQITASLHDLRELKNALDAHSIVAITDPQGRIIFVNDRFCEISKYSRKELLGQDHRIISSGHHPKEFIRGLWSTIANGRIWQGEIKNRAKDGSHYWVETTIVPFLNAQGKPRQYISIRTDITEIKQAQERLNEGKQRLRLILETALEGIVTVDEHGTVESLNPAACRMFGYEPDEVIGRNLDLLIPSRYFDQDDATSSDLRAGQNEIICYRRATVGRRRDGSLVPLELSIGEMLSADRRIFTATVRDISERRQLEQALADSTERERVRIAMELHDGLAQQLGGILYLMHGLHRDLRAAGDSQAETASQLYKELTSALTQARNMAHELYAIPPQPDGLTQGLRVLAERIATEREVECVLACEPSLLVHDATGATHLYRIAQEAVQNALKHGHPTRIDIKLSLRHERVELSVRDNGIGFPPQLDSQGIGLRTMEQRARLMGGHLNVRAHPDGGVEVICSVPKAVMDGTRSADGHPG